MRNARPRAPGRARVLVHDALSLDYLLPFVARYPMLPNQAERALLLAERDDVVCLHGPVDPDYVTFLAGLKIGPARERVVWGPRQGGPPVACLSSSIRGNLELMARIARLLGRPTETLLDPFVSTPHEAVLAASLEEALGSPVRVNGGDPESVARADRKDLMRARAQALGVPLAGGEVVALEQGGARRASTATALEGAIRRQGAATGRAIVKGSRGGGGFGTLVTDAEPVAARRTAEEICASWACEACVVETLLDLTASPNVMLEVERQPGAVRCLGVTDQRLDEHLVHAGNIYPSTARTAPRMVRWGTRLARSLQSEGYEGPLGLDFGEFRDSRSGKRGLFLADVNPRVNGAVYPLELRRRLDRASAGRGRPPVAAFSSAWVSTQAASFAEVRDALSGLLFDPGRGTGVVPYATGNLGHHSLGVIAFGGSRAEAEAAHARAARALGS